VIEHALDREMRLAGIGRPEDRDEARCGTEHHHAAKIAAPLAIEQEPRCRWLLAIRSRAAPNLPAPGGFRLALPHPLSSAPSVRTARPPKFASWGVAPLGAMPWLGFLLCGGAPTLCCCVSDDASAPIQAIPRTAIEARVPPLPVIHRCSHDSTGYVVARRGTIVGPGRRLGPPPRIWMIPALKPTTTPIFQAPS
jgi:hypothetical protein